jgi:hypothetical protein
LHEGGTNSHALAFSTNASAADPTERMRIDSSGNVGIGTTSPTQKLTVGGDVGAENYFAGAQQFWMGEGETAVTATTGTIVFKFVSRSPTQGGRGCLVKLSVTSRRTTNNRPPVAEYWFSLWHENDGVVSIENATTMFEVDFVRATHFAFADLGSGECTITLTNPVAAALQSVGYKIELLQSDSRWSFDQAAFTTT